MKQLTITADLYQYMLDVSLRDHPVLRELREYTATHPLAVMQVAPEQAQFLQFLISLIRAKNILELGTFTGYSALAMALALPEDGKLITCDINPDWTALARDFWQRAGQDHKIELRLAPALESMHVLFNDGWAKKFDFIFIDADKTNYLQYYELALQLLHPRGMIVIDNIFWEGKVIDNNDHGAQTREIRKLNALLKNDDRVFISLLPVADGLFLIQAK